MSSYVVHTVPYPPGLGHLRTDVTCRRNEVSVPLDATDKRILMALQKDGRQSFAALGRAIGLSRTAVQDRVTLLEQSGVISGYHAAVTTAEADLLEAVLFVTIAERPCDPALRWLADLEMVSEVLSIGGDIDALVRCRVPSGAALSALNDQIGAHPLIRQSHSHLILTRLP
ncbi:MAG: Lrp/AsnC family transcriptional regulator [Thalassovita sp.]